LWNNPDWHNNAKNVVRGENIWEVNGYSYRAVVELWMTWITLTIYHKLGQAWVCEGTVHFTGTPPHSFKLARAFFTGNENLRAAYLKMRSAAKERYPEFFKGDKS